MNNNTLHSSYMFKNIKTIVFIVHIVLCVNYTYFTILLILIFFHKTIKM